MCSRCTSLEAQVERLRGDLKLVEAGRLTAERKFADLKAELTNPEKEGTATDEEKALHRLWQELCHHEKSALGPSRLPALRKALRAGWGGRAKIEQAIRGTAKFPFVVDGKRASRGTASQRHDDLELICRNETKLERLAALAERRTEPTPITSAGPIYRVTPLDRAVMSLRDEYGTDRVWGDWNEQRSVMECFWAPCPIKPGEGTPMRIKEASGHGSSLDLACTHGCVHEDLLEALAVIEARAAQRHDEAISRSKAAA